MTNSVLQIRDLRVTFNTQVGELKAVRGIDVDVAPGEILGVVGESGSGKSVSFLAAMGLLPSSATISGSVMLDGQELIGAKRKAIRSVRGKSLAMVFQDPLSALNPVHRVGDQIVEMIQSHQDMNTHDAEKRAVELLEIVGIPQPGERARQYPHEFSGGQRQRLAIARCLAIKPELIIADEIVSALDVSIQAQIINLLRQIQRETGLSFVFITHDVAVARYVGHRIAVMYLGSVVEILPAGALPQNAEHPYTIALLSAVPDMNLQGKKKEIVLQGEVPSPIDAPSGCAFSTRCPYVMDICKIARPVLRLAHDTDPSHQVACHLEKPPIGA